MKTITLIRSPKPAALLAVAFTFAGLTARADTTTYSISSTAATWEDATWNASGGDATSLFPDRAGDIAQNSLSSPSTLTLDISGGGTVTVGQIVKASGSSATWTINAGSGDTAATFVLDNTGGAGNAQISTKSGSSGMVVNADIQMANTDLDVLANAGAAVSIGGAITAATGQTRTLNLINNNGGAVTISNNVGASGGDVHINHTGSGNGGAVISGNLGAKVLSITQGTASSVLRLSGDNSAFVGDVTVNSGTLRLGDGNDTGGAASTLALGAANTVNMAGGVLDVSSSATIAGLQGSAGNVTSAGKGRRTLTLGGSGAYSYAGTIGASGDAANPLARTALNVALDGGTQTLSGASLYGGGTTITSGVLIAANTEGSATGTGAVAVDGGSLEGDGFIGGDTTVTGGSLGAGTVGVAATLTFSSGLDLSGLTGTGQLTFDLGAPGASDKLSAGTLAIGTGTLNFDDFSFSTLSGFGAGVYTLLDSSTSISGTLGADLTGTVGGLSAVLSLSGDGQDVLLTVTAIPEPSACAAIAGALILVCAACRRRRSA